MYVFIFTNSELQSHSLLNRYRVKVVPYTFIRRGVPVREDTYAEPLACEVG